MTGMQAMSHESSGFCFCGDFHGDPTKWEEWERLSYERARAAQTGATDAHQ